MEATRRHASASKRRFLASVGFALTLLSVSCGVHQALEAAAVEYPPTGLMFPSYVERAARKLIRKPNSARAHRVAVLGDSTVMSYPPGKRIPEQLGQRLSALPASGQRFQVASVTVQSLGPSDFYFLSEIVASKRPEQVVIAFNLASLSVTWRDRFARPELVGWVPPGRLFEALSLPLDWLSLTLDRVLLYQAVVHAGGYLPWRSLDREQARVVKAVGDLTRWLDGASPKPPLPKPGFFLPANFGRPDALRVRRLWGSALDGVAMDHPVLRFLGAAVASFESAGIRTLVYSVPFNWDHIAQLGMLDESGLQRTIAHLEETVTAKGGTFADLHRMLPDEAFRDAAGHMTFGEKGSIDGPALVAERLAPIVAALRKNRRRAEN